MSSFFAEITGFFQSYPTVDYILRVVIATFCGAIIGLERTSAPKRPASAHTASSPALPR